MAKSMKKELKKVEKAASKIPKQRALMSGSHYFSTLADPFNVHGEKIPDDINYPSSTFTIVDRRVLTLNSSGFGTLLYGLAGGNASTVYGSLVPCRMFEPSAPSKNVDKKQTKSNPSQTGDPDSVFHQFIVGTQTDGTGGSTTDVMPSIASGHQVEFTFADWQDNVGVPTLYDKCRLVSGGVSIDYLGSSLNAKGRITIASVPRRTLRQNFGDGPITLTQVQNLVGAKIIPVNKLTGASAEYHPLDSVDFQYTDQRSNFDITSLSNHDYDCSLGGELWIVVDAAEAGATCQITGVFNYEAIPAEGILNIVQPSYSRNDPIELSMAMNSIEEVPTTQMGNKATKSISSGQGQLPPISAPEASKIVSTEEQREEGEEDSFMTKVLDGAESVLSNAPGVIGAATPLVRQALGFLGV
jgi:hypothetical protein